MMLLSMSISRRDREEDGLYESRAAILLDRKSPRRRRTWATGSARSPWLTTPRRVGQTGITFFDTLFDENATCHIAYGAAVSRIDGTDGLGPDELRARDFSSPSVTR